MQSDLLHFNYDKEKQAHKLKRMIPAPNSYFMDVKCPGCGSTTCVFSHAQTSVQCQKCRAVISKPSGGKVKLSEGVAFKIKH